MNQMNKDSYSINITGLTDEEVRQRVEEGLTNRADISTDKTTKEIVISNVFTYFNLIFLVITTSHNGRFFQKSNIYAYNYWEIR